MVKPFEVTPPPAGASLHVDLDPAGRRRVCWPLPEKTGFSYWSDLGCAALLLVILLSGIASFAVGVLAKEESPLGMVCCCSAGLLPVLGLAPRLLLVFRTALPAGIVFGPTALIHLPGRTRTYREKGLLSDWWALLGGTAAMEVFPLHQINQVKLDRLGARQRLLVDVGARRVEIGSTLSEPEREWLARQLTQWSQQIPTVLPADREPPNTGFQARPER